MVHQNEIYFASDVKSMLGVKGHEPKIDMATLDTFFALGYPLENRTWFQNISLLPTGTVLTWDIKTHRATFEQYWWWSDINPIENTISEEEAAHVLGDLFQKL